MVTAGERPPAPDEAGTTLPLLEEQVRVTKRDVVTEKVRVKTVVETTEELVRAELDTEHVTVTRVPVDRIVDAAPGIRTEGDVTIVPVLEEILVVETRLLLKEEVHIRRFSTREAVEQPVTLRKQRVVVEETAGEGNDAGEEAVPKP